MNYIASYYFASVQSVSRLSGGFLYPYLSKKIIARENQNHQKIYIPLQPELEIVRLFCPRCKGIR